MPGANGVHRIKLSLKSSDTISYLFFNVNKSWKIKRRFQEFKFKALYWTNKNKIMVYMLFTIICGFHNVEFCVLKLSSATF